MSHNVENTRNISCDIDPNVEVKCQIMYFLVNASSSKPFGTGKNETLDRSHDVEGTRQHPRSKVK